MYKRIVFLLLAVALIPVSSFAIDNNGIKNDANIETSLTEKYFNNSETSSTYSGDLLKTILAKIVYHGNVETHVFHSPGCRYYNCDNCTLIFKSRAEAINAGYRPCKICKP